MLGYTASILPLQGLNYEFRLQLSTLRQGVVDSRMVVERVVELRQAEDLEMTFLGLLAEGIGVALGERRSS